MGVGLRVMGLQMRAHLHEEEETEPWKSRVLAWRAAIGGWALGGNLLFGKGGESRRHVDAWLRLSSPLRLTRLELTQRWRPEVQNSVVGPHSFLSL